MTEAKIEVHPMTPDRWPDFERVFGPNGAQAGCWCMWWRLPSEQYRAGRGAANRNAMKGIVDAGREPGLIAYVDGEPAGWCAVAPRDEYPRVQRSRIVKPIDDHPAWAVTCFFTRREFRAQHVAATLLRHAVEYAAKHGAQLIEGYPVDPPPGERVPPGEAFYGIASTFAAAGFEPVARRKETRPIMRYVVPEAGRAARKG